jgi:hypothetical protein
VSAAEASGGFAGSSSITACRLGKLPNSGEPSLDPIFAAIWAVPLFARRVNDRLRQRGWYHQVVESDHRSGTLHARRPQVQGTHLGILPGRLSPGHGRRGRHDPVVAAVRCFKSPIEKYSKSNRRPTCVDFDFSDFSVLRGFLERDRTTAQQGLLDRWIGLKSIAGAWAGRGNQGTT